MRVRTRLNVEPVAMVDRSATTPRTKWGVLVDRRATLTAALLKVEQEMQYLETTKCGLTCSGCGEVLKSERDFAEHYLIFDERYLNLGECPNKKPNV